jgi:GntR family transcriptional regulator
MYRRIAQELQQQISSGVPEPGGQLPTELELAERYDASRNTVRDAIKWLAANGLVETRQGQGTFVLDRITPFVTTLSADAETGLGDDETDAPFAEVREKDGQPSASPPKVAVLLATGNVAARLQIPEGTQVVSRRRERFVGGTPWSLQTTFYPMDLVSLGGGRLISAESIPGGTVTYLHDALGLTQVGHRDRILVRPPHDDESRFFGLPDHPRTPVVTIWRTGYRASQEGPIPYRVTFTVLRADRNQLVVNSGEVPVHPAAPEPSAARESCHSSSPEDLG